MDEQQPNQPQVFQPGSQPVPQAPQGPPVPQPSQPPVSPIPLPPPPPPLQTVQVAGVPAAQVQVAPVAQEDGSISWDASEHIDYDNGKSWTLYMAIGGAFLATGVYFVVDLLSAIVIVLLLSGILFYSKLKPRNVRYVISDAGISIGGLDYRYSEFRSFSFNEDNGITSIFLLPMQRFMIPVTMYVAPENHDQVAELLAQHLPNQQRKPDFMDRLTAKLRL